MRDTVWFSLMQCFVGVVYVLHCSLSWHTIAYKHEMIMLFCNMYFYILNDVCCQLYGTRIKGINYCLLYIFSKLLRMACSHYPHFSLEPPRNHLHHLDHPRYYLHICRSLHPCGIVSSYHDRVPVNHLEVYTVRSHLIVLLVMKNHVALK